MQKKSYPFACASIKVKEKKLITKERLLRIAESATADEAFKALLETGYGAGEACDVAGFEKLIKREMKNAYEYILKMVPEKNAFDLFLYRNDYLNLKVLLKLSIKKEPLESSTFKENGTLPLEILKSAVTDKNYADLPEEMRKALLSLDRQFSVKEDVSLIGLYLDSAYAAQIQRFLKDIKSDFIKEYMRAFADFTNVISFIRLRLLNFGKEMFKRVYICGGRFEEKTFMELYDVGFESLSRSFAKNGYEKSMSEAFLIFQKTNSLYPIEKARDDFLLDLIKKHSNDVFTMAPSIAYILAKEREAENIRIVMTAKLNGKDADFVSDRIKAMYS